MEYGPFGSMIYLRRSAFSVFCLQTIEIVEDKKYASAVTEFFDRKGIDSGPALGLGSVASVNT
jgi:hypothetical protein